MQTTAMEPLCPRRWPIRWRIMFVPKLSNIRKIPMQVSREEEYLRRRSNHVRPILLRRASSGRRCHRHRRVLRLALDWQMQPRLRLPRKKPPPQSSKKQQQQQQQRPPPQRQYPRHLLPKPQRRRRRQKHCLPLHPPTYTRKAPASRRLCREHNRLLPPLPRPSLRLRPNPSPPQPVPLPCPPREPPLSPPTHPPRPQLPKRRPPQGQPPLPRPMPPRSKSQARQRGILRRNKFSSPSLHKLPQQFPRLTLPISKRAVLPLILLQ
mmetsp:Transcript_13369/g.28023  ORF Transcript_13369/g.28023 Transcript_13369/m.28023 type:complete len:265 (+) Transcript_13369:305-1099(+)